jgi:hypothetical protein
MRYFPQSLFNEKALFECLSQIWNIFPRFLNRREAEKMRRPVERLLIPQKK